MHIRVVWYHIHVEVGIASERGKKALFSKRATSAVVVGILIIFSLIAKGCVCDHHFGAVELLFFRISFFLSEPFFDDDLI